MDGNVPLSGAVRQAYADAPEPSSPHELTGAALKLVIWDLDDTLWRGTLSEEEVELDEERAELVRELNRRGIVNSICSKNDLAAARERLQRDGLWEQFVFPSISWSPKGARVAQIIDEMQLRATNVLFVDDNVGNLQEALHFVPDLQIAGVELLAELLELPQAAGKDDRALTRLAQYRVLERKVSDRELATESNEDFLRSCEIHVQLCEPLAADSERLLELINRSNQLNFTKSRMTEPQLRALLAEPARETRYVRVYDRYGDYGVCGFYSLSEGRLSDFVLSCRILHMGVEQWLYARLGEPQIEVLGEVASPLQPAQAVDWITFEDESTAAAPAPAAKGHAAASSSRILLKGGCDLFMLNGFLGGAIKTEFTYPSASGAEVHSDHTEILRRSSRATIAEFGPIVDRLPFLDRAAYGSRIVRRPKSFGTLIFSVLMDYTQGLYRLRDSDFVVPYGQHDEDATDPANWSALEGRWGNGGVDRPFLEWFAESFEYEGALPVERFQENVRWLSETLPSGCKLVLINGAEVALENDAEPARHLHHERMNRALEQVVGQLPNATICDVRPIVVSPEDLKDNLRHYTRQTYLQMAELIKQIVGDELRIEQRPLLMRLHRAQRKLERTVERATVRLSLR
jgi:FkbH-like protein